MIHAPSPHGDEPTQAHPTPLSQDLSPIPHLLTQAALLFLSVLVCRVALTPWLVAIMGVGQGSLGGYLLVFGAVPRLVGGKKLFRQAFCPGPSPQKCLVGVLVGALNYLPCLALASVTEVILGVTPPQSHPAVFGACSGVLDALGLTLALVAFAPLLEEAFFRGTLQRLFVQRLSPRLALLLTSVLFALIHLDGLARVPPRLEMGLIFGALALSSKSIWPAAFAHATHNLLGILADTLIPQESLAQIHLFPHLTVAALLTLIPLIWILRRLATTVPPRAPSWSESH